MTERPRLLVVANSQGTPSGLSAPDRYLSYPLQIQALLCEVDCTVWAMSSLSVETVNSQFLEVVLQHRPNIVVLQCGIIEGCPRILPKRLRAVLEHVVLGRTLTGFLHKHRVAWLRFLSRLGVQFRDMSISEFKMHLRDVHAKCRKEGIELVLVSIPTLSEEFDRNVVPLAIKVMSHYDAALLDIARSLDIPDVDAFHGATDPKRNSLYLPASVHFSVAGHTLIARNIANFLTNPAFAARAGQIGGGADAPAVRAEKREP